MVGTNVKVLLDVILVLPNVNGIVKCEEKKKKKKLREPLKMTKDLSNAWLSKSRSAL